jgi:hypothetical protein
MTNMNQSTPKPANTDATKQAVLKDIEAKWDKFSQTELSALKGRDDLVSQVETKYGFDKAVAQREVDAILKGRSI